MPKQLSDARLTQRSVVLEQHTGGVFRGTVTTYIDTTHFKVSGLPEYGNPDDFPNDFFKDYWVYVAWDAGGTGAAPQGESEQASAYISSDGTITHTAFTTPLAVGDIVLLFNPGNFNVSILANLNAPSADSTANVLERDVIGNKTDTAQTTVGTTHSIMRYIKGALSKLDDIVANQTGEETTGSYNLPNDTAENTTIEITNTKRLNLDSVWLDFNTLVQDVTIKVYHKIDGTNYRQYDEFSWATTDEDGVFISDITINNDWKLTITSPVAQGGIKAIPYNVIKTTMEA